MYDSQVAVWNWGLEKKEETGKLYVFYHRKLQSSGIIGRKVTFGESSCFEGEENCNLTHVELEVINAGWLELCRR